MIAFTPKDKTRLLSKIVAGSNGCWIFGGARAWGYGRFHIGGRADGRVMQAHRVSYEMFVGPIPDGLQIDHLCRTRACIRPDHLEVVTSRENTLRGENFAAHNAQKTHCPEGHAYDDENTYWSRRGQRNCRSCDRIRAAAKRDALRASGLTTQGKPYVRPGHLTAWMLKQTDDEVAGVV